MQKFVCVETCFTKNQLFEAGETVMAEEAPNKHFKLYDSDAKVKEVEREVEVKETEEAEIESLRAKFDELKSPYDRRWGKQRLENELIMARKNRGE
jgi:hypothetical protein